MYGGIVEDIKLTDILLPWQTFKGDFDIIIIIIVKLSIL